jgi:hypothetical protein
MKDFSESIKATLYERATSPFYSTFLLSWVFWNWKIILAILFGHEKMNRIEYILSINSEVDSPYFKLWLYPFLTALFLLLILPLFSNLMYRVTLFYRNKRVEWKLAYEDKEPLSRPKSLKLRQELRSINEKLANVIESKDNEILELIKENDDLKVAKRQLNSANAKNKVLTNDIEKTTNVVNCYNQIIHHLTATNQKNEYRISAKLIKDHSKEEIIKVFNDISENKLPHKKDADNKQLLLLMSDLELFVYARETTKEKQVAILTDLGHTIFNVIKELRVNTTIL